MKYTIQGFSQAKMIELGMDCEDALILRWFIDFRSTDSMVKKIIDGEEYYWIKYEGLLNDLPILKVKNKDSLYRRFKKLSNIEVLRHKTIRDKGTYSFYTLGPQYIGLISDCNTNQSDINPRGYGYKVGGGTDEKSEQKINLLKDINLLNNNIVNFDSSKKKTSNKDIEAIWNIYPNKKGKAVAYKKIEKLLKKYTVEELIKCVERYSLEVKGKDKQYIMHGSTFFNGRFEDYIEEEIEAATPAAEEKGEFVNFNLEGKL